MNCCDPPGRFSRSPFFLTLTTLISPFRSDSFMKGCLYRALWCWLVLAFVGIVRADNPDLYDDRNSSLVYGGGGWTYQYAENQHNGTGMMTTTAGSNVKLTFSGTFAPLSPLSVV